MGCETLFSQKQSHCLFFPRFSFIFSCNFSFTLWFFFHFLLFFSKSFHSWNKHSNLFLFLHLFILNMMIHQSISFFCHELDDIIEFLVHSWQLWSICPPKMNQFYFNRKQIYQNVFVPIFFKYFIVCLKNKIISKKLNLLLLLVRNQRETN